MEETERPLVDPTLVDRRVLIVEDDHTVREVAATYLHAAGLLVSEAADGFAGLDAVAASKPDLVLLDRMLPGIDGVEVLRRLRETSSVPVVMLTALGSADDRIAGLEAGADDYISKPFSPRELVLRVQSVLRRTVQAHAPESPFTIGRFYVDPSGHVIMRDGAQLPLTSREFDLLSFLLKHPRQVFDRETLLRAVWGWDIGDLSTITVTVRRIREKIEDDPSNPTVLATVWGVGYRLDIAEEQS